MSVSDFAKAMADDGGGQNKSIFFSNQLENQSINVYTGGKSVHPFADLDFRRLFLPFIVIHCN